MFLWVLLISYSLLQFLTCCRAGDAAHSFPPTGGLGLNSGLGDVHNLAYKLAAVHHGWGSDELLDTYQSDRRQVALVNANQSVKNGKQIFGLLKALGTTDPDVNKARKNLYHNIQDSDAMIKINQGIEGQREHFDNLRLHIGYIYGDTTIPGNVSHFEPSCVPGARLPHAWIRPSINLGIPAIDSSYTHELTKTEVCMKQFSTLDLCPLDRFTLFVSESTAPHYQYAVEELLKGLPQGTANDFSLQTVVFGVDFTLQLDANDGWFNLLKLNQQAVLVRPDQHILTCISTKDSAQALYNNLKEHLGW